jgi:hypothetical protein
MRVLALLFAVLGLSVLHAEGPADYLKEHKLKERLEVRELQGGVVGFTGTFTVIEPDGAWSTGPVLQDKAGEPKAKGKLTAEQLALLAKDLSRYDLLTLPKQGEPVVNPRVVKITYGKTISELQPSPGKDAEADKAIRARYTGIVAAVKTLCVEPK